MYNANLYLIEFVGDYGTENVVLYHDKKEFLQGLENASVKTFYIEFCAHGKTRNERREYLQDIAAAWSHIDQSYLALDEIMEVTAFFEIAGRRYGLIREFTENAII